MSDAWRRRVFFLQILLLAATLALVGLQLQTLLRLQAAERGLRGPGSLRPISVERVFAFPEVTCAPKPVPVFHEDPKKTTAAPPTVASLARQQVQYGLLLSACLAAGVLLGVALYHRAAVKEGRVAQLKSSFVSNVSHEMKTPLAKIQMFAETLEGGRIQDPAKIAEYTRVIHRESRKLSQLLDEVLDFARMEAGTLKYRFAACDLGLLVERFTDDFRGAVDMAGGRLDVAIEPDLPLVEADAKAIGQALQNLLDNALKYSPDRKEIRVTLARTDGSVRLEVADNGLGIADSEQKRIFEKFYRAQSDTVHNTKGAGLGLAIAQHVVQAHGGRIEVASRPGEGSRFTIVLPASGIVHGTYVAETVDHRG